MPLPERYQKDVSDVVKIWTPEGYFDTQTQGWLAQSEARHELYGSPSAEQLAEIRQALVLTPDDISYLNTAEGHETNNLIRRIQPRLSTEAGNFIHLGNTSSDVLDTSLAMQIVRSLNIIEQDFDKLDEALLFLALQHLDTVQVARTHTQQAVPQTFGRQVIGWDAEVRRGVERIARARDVSSYGKFSGEVGTNVIIPPELEELSLAKLGLKPDPAPTQVISRDRHAEVLALMAVNGGTLARIATNIRLLSQTDVGELREPFAEGQQGSSAMPHKRNSELTERIGGLQRVIRGAALAEMESTELWLERDISHSSTERFTFPDAFGLLAYNTRLLTKVIKGLVVYKDRMAANLEVTHGAIYSARLLNAMLDTGKVTRTIAYDVVKGLAQKALDTGVNLQELAADNSQISDLLGASTIPELFDPSYYLRNTGVAFRRLGISLSDDE